MAKKPEICPYCNQPAKWVSNKEVYGRARGESYMIWLCKPCDAYVGCHKNSKTPKGSLANKETRKARIKAHDAFDPLWEQGRIPRGKLYAEITKDLGRQIHIGESSIEQCEEIIQWCQKFGLGTPAVERLAGRGECVVGAIPSRGS